MLYLFRWDPGRGQCVGRRSWEAEWGGGVGRRTGEAVWGRTMLWCYVVLVLWVLWSFGVTDATVRGVSEVVL